MTARPRLPLPHELENMRRSAAMAPLPPGDVVVVLDAAITMAGERAAIRRLLDDLSSGGFAALRSTLNELRKVVDG